MKAYISRDHIYNVLFVLLRNSRGAENYGYNCFKNAIDSTPESEIIYMYECSHCGSMTSEEHQFCPYCGKPMDEVELYGRN